MNVRFRKHDERAGDKNAMGQKSFSEWPRIHQPTGDTSPSPSRSPSPHPAGERVTQAGWMEPANKPAGNPALFTGGGRMLVCLKTRRDVAPSSAKDAEARLHHSFALQQRAVQIQRAEADTRVAIIDGRKREFQLEFQAGCCWVRQCSDPEPSTRSTA